MKALKIILALVAAVMLGVVAGHRFWPGGQMPALSGTTDATDNDILYWVAPMDPNFRRAEPGKSPMGMDLVPVYAENSRDGSSGMVRIDPAVVNNLGVRTAMVEQSTLTQKIDVPGYVQVDEETVHHIHTRVEGWIESMTVKSPGETVTRGQILFELYSPMLVAAQEEYLTAVRTGNRPLIDASRDRLKALGLNDDRLTALRKTSRAVERVPIRAGRDGKVGELNVRAGMYVQPSTIVMSVYSLDSVWLIAELFERDSSWLVRGSAAEVQVASMPDRVWNSAIDYIYPELNSVTRALRARMTLANPDKALRPNMYATVTIDGAMLPDVLHIPVEALIRGGQHNRVVVALGNGQFQSRLVETGLETSTRVQIRNGLSVDDYVVVAGQFLLDSESNIAADLLRGETRGEKNGTDQ